jgi:thiaminase
MPRGATEDGRLKKGPCHQDYLFVKGALPFVAVLASRSPQHLGRPLADALSALYKELDLFEEMAGQHGVSLERVEPTPTCHAYTQYLLAAAHSEPFAVSFAILYGAEKAYLDSWARVKSEQREPSRWQKFIDQWSGEGMQSWVLWIETELDVLAPNVPEPERQRMHEQFRLTALYEYRFWEMAAAGEEWMP